jgi:3-oxoacyl-[acyl-carrier-protein] synthase-3
MRFTKVRLESIAAHLPERVVPSHELERRLAPVYERLRLSEGRLELMTGIRERRHCAPRTRPSSLAIAAAETALRGVERSTIGVVVHASVCRDFLEPATASVVQGALGIGFQASGFDLSNACLGFANAMCLVGGMIERGEIERGLVVSGEDGAPLVEATIADLLARPDATRDDLKRAFASLTIGSGGAACVLAREELAPSAARLAGATQRSATEHSGLCQGGQAAGASGPLMHTDSEALLAAGNELAARTYGEFLREHQLEPAGIERYVTHQVGVAHRRLLLATLGLDPGRDYPTVETLGNMGSASLPVTLALAREAGHILPTHRTALFGIGSGLYCSMLLLEPPEQVNLPRVQ